MPDLEAQKEQIRRFFDGVVVNGVTREVKFIEKTEEGKADVELLDPQNNSISVYLSVPASPIELIQLTEAELIEQLLERWGEKSSGCVDVEEGRYYLKSDTWSSARYHIVSMSFDSLIISQVDEGEKYQQRITLGEERILSLAAALLKNRLSDIKEEAKSSDVVYDGDEGQQEGSGLKEIEDHPF